MKFIEKNMRYICVVCVILIIVFFLYRFQMNKRANMMEMAAQEKTEEFCGTTSCALTH